MKIQVTKDHIDHGVVSEMGKCPVALAISDAVGIPVLVGWKQVKLRIGEAMVGVWDLPARLREFEQDFDDGVRVEPIEFTFPDQVVARIKHIVKINSEETSTTNRRKK